MKLEYGNQRHLEGGTSTGYDWTSAGVGMGMGLINDIKNLALGGMQQRMQLRGQKKALEQQNAAAMDIWHKTNYGAQLQEIKKAGLSEGLIYGMGGAGGSLGGSSAMPSTPSGGGGMGIMEAAQVRLLNAQAKKLEHEAQISHWDEIIKEYDANIAAQEYGNKWEPEKTTDSEGNEWVTGNNKYMMEKLGMERAQFQAATGVANNLIEQYKNGNLKKMSQTELDLMMKELGVKDGTIDKLKLENALTKMEKEFQEKFGMGKDAKGWIDMGLKFIMYLISRGRK